MSKYVKNWFSNMRALDTPFSYQGVAYRTVENFFQAMKVVKEDVGTRAYIAGLGPFEAKKAGRKVELRPDWETVKLDVMEYALRKKFATGTSWARRLLEEEGEIVEWNNWGDRYWGRTLDGRGENRLGEILMRIRKDLRK